MSDGVTYRSAIQRSRMLMESAPDSAAALLEELTLAWADQGEAWLLRARAEREAGDSRAALPSFERAMALGAIDSATGAYEMAVAYADLGAVDSAAAWIERSLAAGYRWRPSLADDESLAPLGEERLRVLAGGADVTADRLEGWRGDLEYLVGEVRRLHWRYRHAALPPEFETQRRRIADGIAAWNDARMVFELQRLLATLHDGHTLVYPFGMRRGEVAWLPLGLYWFEDGIYVLEAGEQTIESQRVSRVGGVSIDETIRRLETWTSHMNPSGFRAMAPVYLTFPDLLVAIGAADSARAVDLTVLDGAVERTVQIENTPIDLDRLRVKLFPRQGESPPMWLARVEEPYWMQSLDSALLYVQVNQISDDSEEPIEEFSGRLLQRLTAGSNRGLVLDLRHNNGGDAVHAVPLVRAITTWRGSRPELPFYVLIGRTTFSAAQTLVNELELYASPMFVGEPTGSPPNRYGNEAPFRLPWSGVMGSISSGYNQGWSSRDARVWTEPHIPVPLKFEDYARGRDPALEAILALERAGGP